MQRSPRERVGGEGRMQCSCLSPVILDIFNRGSRFLFIPSFVRLQTLDSCFRRNDRSRRRALSTNDRTLTRVTDEATR